jgi:uncharacterized protein (DUF885 family)
MRNLAPIAAAALAILPAACSSSSPPPAVAPAPAPQVAAPTAGAPSVDERRKALDALLAEQWEWVMRIAPEFASILGDKRYNDRWSDTSSAAIAARHEERKAFLARFEAIDTTGFPEQEVLNQQLMVHNLRSAIEGQRFEDWLMPVDQMGGFHIQLPQLAPLLTFTSAKDYQDYITRLRAVPGLFDQVTEHMRTGMEKKLMPPRFLLERAVGQAEKLGKTKPEESPFAVPLTKFPDSIPAEEQKRIREELLAAIREQVLPSYVKFTAFLRDEYAPRGRTEFGVWSLPDGEARYAYAVKEMTTTELSPDEIHEIGLREVARIEEEQAAIGTKLGFKDLDAFRKHIRSNKKLHAKSRKDILDRYQKYTDRMYGELPKLFGRLPKQKMIILPVEEFREKEASGAQYFQGIPDGSRPGMVRVNTSDAKKRLTIDMESTAYHEGVPGHHMQIAIQQELPQLPPFRQQAHFGAFIEGWALYSERLGKEVGFYEDPYNDYGRLQDEMLRAIRLVVDTGLHHKHWTRDQVVKFFHDHSTIDEPSVQSETDRYIVWPGQALGYKIGQLTISRLREKARTELGDKFDVRGFHDEVLGAGALPLDVLETRIDAWIARARSAPAR